MLTIFIIVVVDMRGRAVMSNIFYYFKTDQIALRLRFLKYITKSKFCQRVEMPGFNSSSI
jgi:hypothetical protein